MTTHDETRLPALEILPFCLHRRVLLPKMMTRRLSTLAAVITLSAAVPLPAFHQRQRGGDHGSRSERACVRFGLFGRTRDFFKRCDRLRRRRGSQRRVDGTRDFGVAYNEPPKGSAASAAQNLEYAGRFTIDGGETQNLEYFGLAPGLVGAEPVNLQIPAGTRNGCAVPVTVRGGLGYEVPSQTVSISAGTSDAYGLTGAAAHKLCCESGRRYCR